MEIVCWGRGGMEGVTERQKACNYTNQLPINRPSGRCVNPLGPGALGPIGSWAHKPKGPLGPRGKKDLWPCRPGAPFKHAGPKSYSQRAFRFSQHKEPVIQRQQTLPETVYWKVFPPDPSGVDSDLLRKQFANESHPQ